MERSYQLSAVSYEPFLMLTAVFSENNTGEAGESKRFGPPVFRPFRSGRRLAIFNRRQQQ
jgi:hypothetical protein